MTFWLSGIFAVFPFLKYDLFIWMSNLIESSLLTLKPNSGSESSLLFGFLVYTLFTKCLLPLKPLEKLKLLETVPACLGCD